MEDIRKWKEAEGGSMEQEPKKYSLINYFTISLGGVIWQILIKRYT